MFRRRQQSAPAPSQRDELAAWEDALVASGLPLAGLDGPRRRPRLQFAAALPSGIAAERELADVFLRERLTVDVVRGAICAALPADVEVIDIHDVWTGGPALPAQAIGAEYRVVLGAAATPLAEEVATAARRLLARETIHRERPKGSEQRRYDLRPLVDDVGVIDVGPPLVLRIRTRFHPQLGAGRPEEVLAALGDLAGRELTPTSIVRERVLLAGEG